MQRTIHISLILFTISMLHTTAMAQRRTRTPVVSSQESFTPEELVRAFSHPEAQARNKARAELKQLVRDEVDITDAIPELRKIAFGTLQISDRLEAYNMRSDALGMLVVVDRDATATELAKRLAELGPFHDPLSLRMLAGIDEISVDIDKYLFPMFAQTKASGSRQQRGQAYVEGQVAWAVSKLAVDRETAGKFIVERMRWPMDQGYYAPEHFKAVRRCASHCGPLVPSLKQAMSSQSNPIRSNAMIMISALAVYHEDAWEVFSSYVQDRFGDTNSKQRMATSYAHTWVLASEEDQAATLPRLNELNEAVPDWQSWRTSGKSLVSPLHSDYLKLRTGKDVKEELRELSGYTPPVTETSSRRRR